MLIFRVHGQKETKGVMKRFPHIDKNSVTMQLVGWYALYLRLDFIDFVRCLTKNGGNRARRERHVCIEEHWVLLDSFSY